MSDLKYAFTHKIFTAGDIRRKLGLTSRNLCEWRKRRSCFGQKIGQSDRGWWIFSYNDIFNLAILIELQRMGIPLSKNVKLSHWLRNHNLLYKIMSYFEADRKFGIYLSQGRRFYVPKIVVQYKFTEKINKKTLVYDIQPIGPSVFLPLNDLITMIFQGDEIK